MKWLILSIICVAIFPQENVHGQQNGEMMFKNFCAACHTISKGKLVGPDLADVHLRRTDDWLVEFIKSSQAMIQNGDKTAVELFKEYSQTVMPDAPYSTDQIKAIIEYVKSKSPGHVTESTTMASEATTEPEVPVRSVTEATEGEIKAGQMLFSGNARLSSGGPGCISCHHVKHDKLIGGGLLAKDLTDAFSRMNEAGIKAILTSPPFPAMKEAYQNAPITDEEAYSLTAFLKLAEAEQYGQHTRNYQRYFLIAAGLSFAVLMGIFSMIWSRRRKQSVNQKIYNRQVYS